MLDLQVVPHPLERKIEAPEVVARQITRSREGREWWLDLDLGSFRFDVC